VDAMKSAERNTLNSWIGQIMNGTAYLIWIEKEPQD
jgi:hypothetical protein